MKCLLPLVAVALAACTDDSPQDISRVKHILPIGSSHTLRLSHPSLSGCEWLMTHPTAHCEVSFRQCTPDADDASAPAASCVTIKAIKPGVEKLQLIYARPWELITAPSRTVELDVEIVE